MRIEHELGRIGDVLWQQPSKQNWFISCVSLFVSAFGNLLNDVAVEALCCSSPNKGRTSETILVHVHGHSVHILNHALPLLALVHLLFPNFNRISYFSRLRVHRVNESCMGSAWLSCGVQLHDCE